MLQPENPTVRATAKSIHESLWCHTRVGGLARYEKDRYHQVSQDPERVPGNLWIIGILWLAQYYISIAETHSDLSRATGLLGWVEENASPSGLLAEQIHPYTGAPLSVSPLTWSHACFVETVQKYLNAYQKFRE